MRAMARVGLALAAVIGVAVAIWMPGVVAGADEAAGVVVAVRGARIHPVAGEPIDEGTVVISGGRIAAVGPVDAVSVPPEARVIDGRGKVVVPGLIDAGTSLGLVEISGVAVTRDFNESNEPVMPHLRVIDAFNPNSELIPVARLGGVTSALSAPGEQGLISGQSALVRLHGDTLKKVLLRFPVGIHVNLGEPTKSHFGERKTMPSTRMGMAALLRETLIKAAEYRDKWERFEAKANSPPDPDSGDKSKDEAVPPDRDLRWEALAPVLRGELPLIVRAHRVDDIGTALRLADEFEVKVVLRFATEAWRVADDIARRGVPVILGPVTTQPGSMETVGAIYENAAMLHAAGVKIAIQTASAHNVRNLPYEAGLAVTYGLPWDAALRAVTLGPAEILGVADRLGSLEVGKEADLLVLSGDPFQPLSKLEHLFIGGEEIPLRSRQTELYERYRKR